MLTDGAVRQLSGIEFQSLGAATEKRLAAMSMLCGGTERRLCVDDRNKRDWLYGRIRVSNNRPVDDEKLPHRLAEIIRHQNEDQRD